MILPIWVERGQGYIRIVVQKPVIRRGGLIYDPILVVGTDKELSPCRLLNAVAGGDDVGKDVTGVLVINPNNECACPRHAHRSAENVFLHTEKDHGVQKEVVQPDQEGLLLPDSTPPRFPRIPHRVPTEKG